MAVKSRIFNIMQYMHHPETGEELLSEETIKDGLNHRTITKWAYILHDRDVYSALDEEDNPEHKKGEYKPPHWHIVIETKNNSTEISVIAKWFKIKENYVDVAKGRGAFLDCVQYLTHEKDKQQELGKKLYPDEMVSANFDFRKELDKRAERKLKFGIDLDDKDALRYEVLYNGLTLREAQEKYPLAYMNDFKMLEKMRIEYISKIAPPAPYRINYYIEGKGGIGKGLISRAIAKAIIDREGNIKWDDDIFFEVGAGNALFEGYDGQPVIIWNDHRAIDLLRKLGGRENVFNVFDTNPASIKQNIKYGSIRLNNIVNIVNSVEPYTDFLDALAGDYTDKFGNEHNAEDKSQSYRRFPFFLVLHEEDYDFGMNKGVFLGTREYDQYMIYQGVRGSMKKIAEKAGNNYEIRNMLNGEVVRPVIEKHDELVEKLNHDADIDEDEIAEMMRTYGTMPSDEERYFPDGIPKDEE